MKSLIADLHRLVEVARHSGLVYAGKFALLVLRARLMRKSDQSSELRLGVTIGKGSSLDSLNVSSENRKHGFTYVPTPGRAVRVLLANLRTDLSDFTFIDLGSGEGRAMLVAASFPFREVLGVEFSRELHETAVLNIEKATHATNQPGRVRSLHLDAACFEIPCSNCVLYLNNPFTEIVFEQVLMNIERAYVQDGNKVYVLYQQTRSDLEDSKTNNVFLLRAVSYLVERPVHFPSLWDRFLLASNDLYIFESIDRAHRP